MAVQNGSTTVAYGRHEMVSIRHCKPYLGIIHEQHLGMNIIIAWKRFEKQTAAVTDCKYNINSDSHLKQADAIFTIRNHHQSVSKSESELLLRLSLSPLSP